MPRRKWGGMYHKQVVFAAPELEQAPDISDRAESSRDCAESSEPPAQIAAQPNAGAEEFGLCRHGQREQAVTADLQDSQWPCSVVRLHLRTGAGDNVRDL